MNNEISMKEFCTEPVIPDTAIYAFRYDLRHGDVPQSARLALAACEGNWSEVDDLLKQGADPRICRWCDGVCTCSPLYFAIEQGVGYLAKKLYDAGDRLDDLHLEGCKIPDRILMAVQNAMRWGKNLFVDESKPLSECARTFQVARCRELIDSASAEELALAAEAISGEVRRGWEAHYWEILSMLKAHGADFTRAKPGMVQIITALKNAPLVLRLDPEYATKIEDFLTKI